MAIAFVINQAVLRRAMGHRMVSPLTLPSQRSFGKIAFAKTDLSWRSDRRFSMIGEPDGKAVAR